MVWNMMKTYFNSHPHEEDDMTGDVLKVAVRISTHILTKRMTSFHRLKFHFISISTHILTKRMTIVSVIPITSRNISTHILTKRMTEASQNLSLEHIISTHILTKRMTQAFAFMLWWIIFQLTSSRRGWLSSLIILIGSWNISTHILTKRMTCLCVWIKRCYKFQLTSSRRGWPAPFTIWFPSSSFQLTSSRRGWRKVTYILNKGLDISTHILTKRMTMM